MPCPLGGRITIETCNVQIDETYAKTHMGVKPGEFVMIAVSDTGHGMDSATRQNIFEPFFTTKQRGKGTGLGLATVYGMVKQSGGDIWVYSEPGQGTTFKLYFPRVAEPVSPGWSEEVELPRQVASETVMLVEDEAQVRDLEVRMLKQLGYTVLAAANGDEAIGCQPCPPGRDCPAGDGRGDAEHERQAGGGCHALPPAGSQGLILVRLHREHGSHHGVLDSSVDFLTKPFSRETLARKIREILSR